jgi:uncharacterized protein (DUF433 family)
VRSVPKGRKVPLSKLVDLELYSIGEAARLLGISAAKVARWLDGYERAGTTYPPVIRPEPTRSDIVTWGEFVELGYLREYRKKDVSLQQLRPVIERLRKRFRTDYPLAHHKPFIGPGRKLVMETERELGIDHRLYMVIDSDQLLLSPPAEAFLDKVEFEADVARLWRPSGSQSHVVIDPETSFGIPTIQGIRTEAITELYQAGEPPALIARTWDLDETDIHAAIRFELGLRRAA